MPFIDDILKYKTLSIVGMEKNTGKTECLNYVLGRLPVNLNIAVTSIGIDGERVDQVTKTAKPEIFLREGTFFGTTEKHYRYRTAVSEVYDLSLDNTSLGRVVTSQVKSGGKVLLSGPASTFSLRKWMDSLNKFDIELTIIDGALSRLSSASPIVSESLILSTGAALSANINTLVNKTAFIVELINLEEYNQDNRDELNKIESGVWVIKDSSEIISLNIKSSFSLDSINPCFLDGVSYIYITGAITDRFLNIIRQNLSNKEIIVIVRDFTKIFLNPITYNAFIKAGGRIEVINKTNLIAVTVNPVSPSGYILDSQILCKELFEKINIPVYDLRNLELNN